MENKKLLGSLQITPEIIKDIKKSVDNIAGFEKKIQEYIHQNITNLLDIILFGAIHLQSSDIHIEPEEDNARLRIRIDGLLQDVLFFDQDVSKQPP